MKRYETFNNDPIKLADYIMNKLEISVKAIVEKTGNRFYHSDVEYQAVRGIIISELFEEIDE